MIGPRSYKLKLKNVLFYDTKQRFNANKRFVNEFEQY